MKSVADQITKMGGSSNILDKIKTLQEAVESHPAVQELRQRYPERQMMPNDLMEYARNCDSCAACPGLEKCPSLMKGHEMIVNDQTLDEKWLSFSYKPCNLLLSHEYQRKIGRLIKSHFVPNHILNQTFNKMELDPSRKAAILVSMRFCDSFKRGETTQGLYLHGPMGVGKSAIAGAMTQELAKRNTDVLMVYVPDFLGEIKSAIKTGEVESKLKTMKDVSVLILDDIGAESLSTWTRDEVIGPVIQKRMERLPTIFTSNLTLGELHTHFSRTKDESSANIVKASRLIERIDPFVTAVKVTGKNRRRN